MGKISGIYRIVCVANGDYYYGSSADIQTRWVNHKRKLNNLTHENKRIQHTWNKYGALMFRMEICEFVSKDDLFEVENKYLKEHIGKPHCMNISADAYSPSRGRKLGPLSEETKKKISKARTGQSNGPFSEETKQKMKETWNAQNKKIRRSYGPLSEETKKKMSIAHTGKTHSEESKQKIRESVKRKLSTATK